MKQTAPTKKSDIVRTWHIFDVKDKILGRVSTEIANKLTGKNKPYYVANLDCGDYVVVINCSQVKVDQKIYRHFSGYPGGQKEKPYKTVMAETPERIIRQAVSGMLPNNKLRASNLKRLYIYPGDEHPYKKHFEVK